MRMNDQMNDKLDAPFLDWLSGLIDGEGHFAIRKYQEREAFGVFFRMNLRADDIAILMEIQERLGMGRLYVFNYEEYSGYRSRPQASFVINTKEECRRFVEIMEGHQLRSKKRQDYLIWQEAVLEIANKPVGVRDQVRLKYLHDKIRLVRKYEGREEPEELSPESIQLELGL